MGGGDERRKAVGFGFTVPGPSAVLPSGVVTPTRTKTAMTTAPNAAINCRPLNGPTTPCRSRLWVNPGRSAIQMAVLKLK